MGILIRSSGLKDSAKICSSILLLYALSACFIAQGTKGADNALFELVIVAFVLMFQFSLTWKANNIRVNMAIIAILALIYSPFALYGQVVDGSRYFGSAYGVDFQQYLSVINSLAVNGLPFNNPYMPGLVASYHYLYSAPVAVFARFALAFDLQYFESLSVCLFIYQLWSSFVLLSILGTCFYGNSVRGFCGMAALIIVGSSLKWVYALYQFLNSPGLSSSYDTPFGFKTVANDFLFGSHYILSSTFMVYIIAVTLYFRRSLGGNEKLWSIYLLVTSFLAAFMMQLVNGFSLVVCSLAMFSFAVVDAWDRQLRIPQTIIYFFVPLFALLSLVNTGPSHGEGYKVYFELELAHLGSFVLSIMVNFGPIILAGLVCLWKDWKDRIPLVICIFLILVAAFILKIDLPIENNNEFNVTRRLGSSVIWILAVLIDPKLVGRRVLIILIVTGSLTFLSQYLFFLIGDKLITERHVLIANNVVNSRNSYQLTEHAWKNSFKDSFNFDIIVGKEACKYPNSAAALRYSPSIKNLANFPEECNSPHRKIDFVNNKYLFVEQ